MKTIWLVNPYGPIEGENWREYSFNQFGKYLSANGYNVIWWTANFSHHFKKYRSKGWKDITVCNNFTIRLVPTTSYRKNVGFGRMFKDYVFGKCAYKKMLDEDKPDLILAYENPITMGRPSYRYAKKNNIPMVYDQMDIWPEFIVNSLKSPFSTIANYIFAPVRRKRKKIYNDLAGSIALGKHYQEFMHEVSDTLKSKPTALVYNGIDVDEFRTHLHEKVNLESLPQKKNEEIWCVFAGTLGPSYDIPSILKCAERMSTKGYKEFKFIIAGSGPYEPDVQAAANALDNLWYVGKLLPSQLIPIYGRCDVGLSTYSSGSNVDMCDKFYDYTAAGLAVVNSLRGEVSEHIEQRHLGFNYEAENADSLYEVLIQLKNRSCLQQLKQNSSIAGELFDAKVQNKKLLDLIESIL